MDFFTTFAKKVATTSGRPIVFGAACATILVWAVSGPLFGYSDTWQLVINTGTTIITFLMVFLIQNTQNRDGAAIQAKLDELLRASKEARNGFVGIENFSQEQIDEIIAGCEREAAGKEEDPEVRERLDRVHASLGRVARTNWLR